MSEGAIRYSSPMLVRLPAATKAAVCGASRQNGMKAAQYVRQAISAALRADGINPTPEIAGADLSNPRGA